MTPEAWLVAGLIVAMFLALGSGRFPADVVVLAVVLLLLVAGVLTPADALRGFANPGVLTVAFLYVVATGLKETGAINIVASGVLGRPRSALEAQARLVLPVAGLSAFINNTPIVAMFLPVLSGVARRTGIAPSRLFLPLSYAAILGGVCTLIGTSTNVVLAGLIADHNAKNPAATVPAFGMFTITAVGLPVALAGLGYVLLAGRRLLPDRQTELTEPERARRYAVAMRVGPDSPVAGRTVERAGLRHLPGLFLARIERADATVIAVAPDEELRAGDTLVFVGLLESVVDLQKIRGLLPVAEEVDPGLKPAAARSAMRLGEVVISPGSPLVGRSVREGGFRTRYNAVIIGVHRHGQRLKGKIGDIVLRPGDTLLIEAEPDFARRYKDSADFYLVSELEGAASPRHDRAWLALAILAGVILFMSLGSIDAPWLAGMPGEMVVAMAGALFMIVARCCSVAQARSGLDWQILVVIAASFGVGQALQSTGLAARIADSLTGWAAAAGSGRTALLATVYATTLLFTALINNNAAAVLIFPILLRIHQTQGVPFTPLAVCAAVAASCEFMTPIGYQTNLMVMGPGGYRWGDYLRFGTPLTLLCAAVCVGAASAVY